VLRERHTNGDRPQLWSCASPGVDDRHPLARRRKSHRTVDDPPERPDALGQTRPPPVLGSLNEVRPKRIGFDVPNRVGVATVGGDLRRTEPALVDVAEADRSRSVSKACSMQRRQVVQELRQLRTGVRPEHQVPVVRHQNVGQQLDGNTSARSVEKSEKLVIVLRTAEELATLDSSVDHMHHAVRCDVASSARHSTVMATRGPAPGSPTRDE
jgi:hypothetical protein